MQLIDQINNSFEKNHFTLGVFIDFSKAFDTIDHYTLECRIKENNLRWFESQQYITDDNKTTPLQTSFVVYYKVLK